ncbi:MAG TPA: S8 family serine peptidase [Natronosporangium sp.]|nr:S8 family serine peptidase [Natronosporangium sp.]
MRRRRATPLVLAVLLALVPPAAPAAAAQSVTEGQWWHEQWRMDEVWAIADGSGVTVAVLDTGVDASVPELAGAVLPGADFVGGGDGRTDYDVDGGGHGTAMASLIAGNGSGSGLRGVAPGAAILPVAVLDAYRSGSSELDSGVVAEAIRWAADNGADVINMSFAAGADVCLPVMVEAIRYAVERDAILVASSGNAAGGPHDMPGLCPGVLTVGATDALLEPWERSHRSEYVDVTGPGVYISSVGIEGQVRYANGTSDAAALVSGAVALVRSHFPDASADEVLRRIIATARDLPADAPDGWDEATGYGIVRPYHALTERVPPDAPNPVFDELAALAPTSPDGEPPQTPPAGDAAPGGRESGVDGEHLSAVLMLVTGVVLLAGAAVAVTVLVMRQRGSGRAT